MNFCSSKSPARRRYLKSSLGVMVAYLGFVIASGIMVRRWHPQGWHLYLTAALPSIPLVVFAYVVGRYLREERDEYERDVVIRGMLWGSAAMLSVSVFTNFLESYGWRGHLPPFTEFMLFWIAVGVTKIANRMTNRVADE